jgi:hypothetical protein
MRFAFVGLAALLAACAAPEPGPTGADGAFTAEIGQVMLFSPRDRIDEGARGYVALVYRGQRGPAETVFEQVPYDRPPSDVITTDAPGILVPANPTTLESNFGVMGDVVAVLDTRAGAVLGVEDIAVEIIEATPETVRYRVEVLTP